MNFRFFKGQKIFDVDVRLMNLFTQFIGLMFTSKNTKIRLFSYSKNSIVRIHSWFVFYSFLIVWLDDKKRIVAWKKVFPFTSCVVPPKKFRHFIEIPIDDKYLKEIKFVVGKAKV